MTETTVVLGGGGVWGVAWMTGLLAGLAERGADLSAADAFIGTSAGSVISAQVASGLALAALYQRQTDVSKQPRETPAPTEGFAALMQIMAQPGTDLDARVREMGAFALAAKSIPYAQRRADIVERLGVPDAWPTKRLVTTAVDCETGELKTFDAASGVSIHDAVAASCAVPGVWPTAPLLGRHYMDGGVWRTAENAHLAKGARRVIIVSPVGAMSPSAPILMNNIAMLEQAGARVALIVPSDAARESQALGMLDPASRKPAAEAGRAQGLEMAEQIRGALA